MTKKIKLVIADDEQLIRSGLKIMLETYEEIEVVGLAANGQEAFELTQNLRPDLVLMDIRMPVTNGIEGTRLIKSQFPEVAVLIVTTFQDTDYIVEAMQLGASGYLLKDSDYEEIYRGINVALSGKVVMDPQVSNRLIQHSLEGHKEYTLPDTLDLTEKEHDLLRLVAKGMNNKEIASQLYLSEGTIKNNISQLLFKLELRDRTQLAIFAIEHGLNK